MFYPSMLLLLMFSQGTEQQLSWDRYHPLEDFYQFISDLQHQFPSSVTVEEIGRTYEDRALLLLKVCDGECGAAPVFWLDSGLHAREWIGPAVLSSLAQYLVRERKSPLVRYFDWHILLMANPDGYLETWEGDRQWRKNKNPEDFLKCSQIKIPAHGSGVDLNRNFGYKWEDSRPKANSRCSQVYHGLAPFSENETRAIRDALLPRQGNITVYLSVHSSGEKLIIPWGHTDQPWQHEQNILQLLQIGRAAMGPDGVNYTIGNVKAAFGSFAHGGAVNWAASIGVRFPFVIELVNKKLYGGTPPANRIKDEAEIFRKFVTAIADNLTSPAASSTPSSHALILATSIYGAVICNFSPHVS